MGATTVMAYQIRDHTSSNLTSEYDQSTSRAGRRSGTNGSNEGGSNILKITLIIMMWISLFAGIIFLTYYYLEQQQLAIELQIKEVQTQNSNNVQLIKTEIQNTQLEFQELANQVQLMTEQLGFIHEQLELTGETITGSDQTRQALTDRISDLDRQLIELRRQLQKLEEAARVY